MSYAVARMQKMKSGNLGGAYRHNERIFENHSNKDIDPEKTHLNYELTDRDRSIPYDTSTILKYPNVLYVKMPFCVTNGLLHQTRHFLKI